MAENKVIYEMALAHLASHVTRVNRECPVWILRGEDVSHLYDEFERILALFLRAADEYLSTLGDADGGERCRVERTMYMFTHK